MQLTHYNSKFNAQQFPITLVCDGINNAPNIGSLFRIADAFGVEELILCGEGISIGRRITKTSRSTEKYVSYSTEPDAFSVISKLKDTHYLIALEITDDSRALDSFTYTNDTPIALVIGHENYGISASIIQQCHTVLHINMYGNNSSMNVAQAASIALYALTNQLRMRKT